MTELEAAQAIAAGKLPSPHKFSNMTLFAVRVTGTGMAYRDSLDEFVWRDPSLYLNDEFLARVAGLPLIWEHPEKGSLNSKEFANRVIGACMFGYIVGEEVWAVARVYDDEAIKLMTDGQLSTSPGVVFTKGDGNVSGTTTDGDTLLVEGRPSTLCHLAVCAAGVWDKGQAPTGIQNDTLPETPAGDVGMAEHDEKADADKARHDAAEKMDAKLDAIMDAFKKSDARLDAFEKEKNDAKRMDAARKDKFGHRKDGEKYCDWKARHDADEKEYADAIRNINDASEKDCMDAAKDARKDAEEEEKRHDKDFEKWAKEEEDEPEHKGDKSKKDAEAPEDKKKEKEEEKAEKEEEKPDSRKDSAMSRENEELKARLAKLEATMLGITAEAPGAERDALAAAQSRADSVLAMLGDRASAPTAGEKAVDYRRRLVKRLAIHSPTFKGSRFDGLDDAQLALIEDRVYADAAGSARTTASATPGMLQPYVERDRAGREITKYYGDISGFLAPFVPTQTQICKLHRKGMN